MKNIQGTPDPQGSNPKAQAKKSAHVEQPSKVKGRFQKHTLIFQWLMRSCAIHLSGSQLSVTMFIFDRTYGWGKTSEVITYDHFLNGIPSDDPEKPYAGPLKMARATLTAALSELIEMGLVMTEKMPNRGLIKYGINTEWVPPVPKKNKSQGKPKRSKELQNQQTSVDSTSSKIELEPVQKLDCSSSEIELGSVQKLALKKSKEKNRKVKKGKGRTPEPLAHAESLPEESIEERIARASSANAAARRSCLLKWSSVSASVAWEDAIARFWPDEPRFTTIKAQGYALHHYGKKWIGAGSGRTVASWLEYLDWVVSRWSIVRAEHFGWMHDGSPAVPAIGFFVKFAAKFEQAYEQKQSLETISKMSPRDREVARMVRSGTQQEAAEKTVDERTGLARERERLERAAASLKRENLSQQRIRVDQEQAAERRAAWKERSREAAPSTAGPFEEWR
jgi:hypothetical protein